MKTIYKYLYFGWSFGFTERPFTWAIGPHPAWANAVSEWLRKKWLEEDWDCTKKKEALK